MESYGLMSLIEGSRVSFIGDPSDQHDIGDMGLLISADSGSSHVRWTSGASEGQITFHSDEDLVVVSKERRSAYYDSLGDDKLVRISIRNVLDRLGSVGLLNALNDDGHLSVFQPIADEAISMVSSRIRQDPSFIEVLSDLDEDEGDGFIAFATLSLLRDAFGYGGGDD